MNNLVKVIGLEDFLKEVDIEFNSDNFEGIYGELYVSGNYKEILEELENRVYRYFSSLELPDNPTIYD